MSSPIGNITRSSLNFRMNAPLATTSTDLCDGKQSLKIGLTSSSCFRSNTVSDRKKDVLGEITEQKIPSESSFKTPEKPSRAITSKSPLSEKAKDSLLLDIKKLLQKKQIDTNEKINEFIKKLIKEKDFSGLPEELKSILSYIIVSDKNASIYISFKKIYKKIFSSFMEIEVPKHINLWIQQPGWSSDKLLSLSTCLGIKIPQSIFVRIKISKGKIIWKIYHPEFKKWYIPEKKGLITSDEKPIHQNLSPIDTDEKDESNSFVDLTVDEFIMFKKAGKRNSPDKITLINKKILFERKGRNKIKLNIDPQPWDVGIYSQLTKKKSKDNIKKLNMDHMPQDKWLLKAYSEYPSLEDVVKTLKYVKDSKTMNPEKNFEKLLKKHSKSLSSETMKLYFPILETTLFMDTLDEVLKWERLTSDRKMKLKVKMNEISKLMDEKSLDEKLSQCKNKVTANGLAMAVPEDIHKHSRTFALNGRVTKERIGNNPLKEIFLDHVHYQDVVFPKILKKKFYENIEPIGAFRYHYRQVIKHFKISILDPEIVTITNEYDIRLINFLKDWKNFKNG